MYIWILGWGIYGQQGGCGGAARPTAVAWEWMSHFPKVQNFDFLKFWIPRFQNLFAFPNFGCQNFKNVLVENFGFQNFKIFMVRNFGFPKFQNCFGGKFWISKISRKILDLVFWWRVKILVLGEAKKFWKFGFVQTFKTSFLLELPLRGGSTVTSTFQNY